MDEIRTAFNRGDMPSLGRAVHSLRGAAGSLAAGPCSAAALRLENSADRFDSAGVAESLAELELEVARLMAALSPTGHSETAADVAI
jgi:HPt (histidine-containing phosphotransfer) domain-containing protein